MATDLLSFGAGGIDLAKPDLESNRAHVEAASRDYHIDPRLGNGVSFVTQKQLFYLYILFL